MTYAYQSLSDLQDHRRCPEVDTAFKDLLFPPNKCKWMEVGKEQCQVQSLLCARSIMLVRGWLLQGGHMILDDHIKHTKNGSRTMMRN